MNNFVIGLKRFFTNKNVVTIILVIVILVVLYFGYSGSIKKQTNPVNIPVAAVKIEPQTKITKEMVKYKSVANIMINENVLRASNVIIGKSTNINVTIPEGSPFYKDWIIETKELPGSWIEQLDKEKGEEAYYMSVDTETTLGNSVLPDTYIDMYMRTKDENGTPMFGKLLKNIKVLVVHDSNGKNVFSDTNNIGRPAKIGFAVSQDMYILLRKAEELEEIELVLAPKGEIVPKKDEVIVTSATLRDYIDAQTITVEEDVIIEETEEPTEEGSENNTQIPGQITEQNNTQVVE